MDLRCAWRKRPGAARALCDRGKNGLRAYIRIAAAGRRPVPEGEARPPDLLRAALDSGRRAAGAEYHAMRL
ncbi:hypothetical protein ACQUSR_05510 [Streptomyces sp. P1-3]|uniref:hypothetical protein n=1 Tax=Streptomyces sp. P1-3 TaxID=3421658 RepID=UPI003D35E3D8